MAIVSFVVFLPLLRYWLEHPDIFGFRAWSRLGLGSRAISGEVWLVFLSNLLRGLLMLLAGLYAVFFPAQALAILVIAGGALLLVDGVLGPGNGMGNDLDHGTGHGAGHDAGAAHRD